MNQVLSWQLWRLLAHPPSKHPVFKRWVGENSGSRRFTRVVESLAPITLGSGLLICSAMWFLPRLVLLPQLFMLWGMTPLLFVILNSTLFSALWAASIGKTIADAYVSKRYELLRLTPTGALKTHWAIATACLHRSEMFKLVHFQRNAVIYQILLPAAFVLLLGYIVTQPGQITLHTELFVIYGAGILVFLADFIYSALIGALAGMIMPVLTRNSLNSGVWSLAFFLGCQLISYGLIILIDLFLLPMLFDALGLNGFIGNISIALMRLAVFFIVRESVVAGLWRIIGKILEADAVDVQGLLSPQ
jgi:hypothetical protein